MLGLLRLDSVGQPREAAVPWGGRFLLRLLAGPSAFSFFGPRQALMMYEHSCGNLHAKH